MLHHWIAGNSWDQAFARAFHETWDQCLGVLRSTIRRWIEAKATRLPVTRDQVMWAKFENFALALSKGPRICEYSWQQTIGLLSGSKLLSEKHQEGSSGHGPQYPVGFHLSIHRKLQATFKYHLHAWAPLHKIVFPREYSRARPWVLFQASYRGQKAKQ